MALSTLIAIVLALVSLSYATQVDSQPGHTHRNVVIFSPRRHRMPTQWPRFVSYAIKIQRYDEGSMQLVTERTIDPPFRFPHSIRLRDGAFYNIITEGIDFYNNRHYVESRTESHGFIGTGPFMTKSAVMHKAVSGGFLVRLRLSSHNPLPPHVTQWMVKYRPALDSQWQSLTVSINNSQVDVTIPSAGPYEFISCAVGENGNEAYSIPAFVQIYLSPCRTFEPFCKNGGQCRVAANGPICSCRGGFRGLRCESEYDASTQISELGRLVQRLNTQLAAQARTIYWLRRHCDRQEHAESTAAPNGSGEGSGLVPEVPDKDAPRRGRYY